MLQTGGVLEVLISIEVLTIVLKRMKTILSKLKEINLPYEYQMKKLDNFILKEAFV